MRRLVVSLVTAALAVTGLAVLEAPNATAATAPNLLSANQASIESTSAGFASGYGREKISRTRWAKAAHGHAVLAMTSTTSKAMAARTVMAGQIVAAGATYSGGMVVQPSSNVRKPVTARAFVVFTASSGKVLATVAGSWVTTRAGRWVRLGVAGAKAPARTASVSLYAEVYTKAKGLTYFSDEWGLWAAAKLPGWSMPPTTDSVTPTAPVVRGSSNAASTTVAFSFSSTDNVGVAGYRVWFAPGTGVSASNPVPTATVTTGSYVRPSLAPGTYSAIVSAFDRAGHQAFASRVVVTLGPPPSTANLLAPSEASFESGIAGIVQPGDPNGAVVSLTRSTAQAAAGASSLRIGLTTAGTVTIRTERSWTPAVAGQDYYGSLLLMPTSPGQQAVARLNYYDKNFTNFATQTGTVTSLPTGTWTRLRAGGNAAPAGTAYVAVVLSLLGTDGTSGPASADVFYSDAWGLWQSATLPPWGMPTVPQGMVAAFIGDSYALGVGIESPYTTLDRFTTRIASTMGWRELNISRGGVGFTNTATAAGCGMPYCGPYSTQVALAVASHVDVVIVTGGRNDGAASASTENAAVSSAISTLHAQLPSARIVVVAPLWDVGSAPKWLKEIGSYESAAVTNASSPKVTYIPNAYDWLTGLDGSYFWSVDGIHPSGKACALIADNIVATLADRPR